MSEYSHEQNEEALDAYRATEEALRDDAGAEVVLLGADSHESLMATHGRFFTQSRRHVDDYITDRLDELLRRVRADSGVASTPTGSWPVSRPSSLRGSSQTEPVPSIHNLTVSKLEDLQPGLRLAGVIPVAICCPALTCSPVCTVGMRSSVR